MIQKLLPAQAAWFMGVTPMFVRINLRRNKLPFGFAVKNEVKWSYYINPRQFAEYMRIPYDQFEKMYDDQFGPRE